MHLSSFGYGPNHAVEHGVLQPAPAKPRRRFAAPVNPYVTSEAR